ncbi:MAG: hypothetical protein J1E32_05440 [Treponema sp.]|nr:hypothetical protein [Treponema sp.]
MATQAAGIDGVDRNTVNRYYVLLRRTILNESIREALREIDEYEFDESGLGGGGGCTGSEEAERWERCLCSVYSNAGRRCS